MSSFFRSASTRPGLLVVLVSLRLALAGWAAEVSREQLDFFERKIRPILVERCYACHSTAEKVKGGLILETREDLLRGGDSGPAIVVGDPEHSRLIDAVRYLNRELQMPPKNPLSADQVRDLETWVKQGAPDPRQKAGAPVPAKRVIDLAEGRKFWAFQPVQSPAVPVVKQAGWVRTPVDAFVIEKLEAKGLKPAPATDRRTLLRRATFDLTGLPPTPEEVAAFMADRSPDAFARVVDRLLNSPRYGERWGRHWLDVARYADSNGLDENVAFGNAWRYRDYVINAFNQDKPYDRFVREQIAGDLLPAANAAARRELLTATGFLAIGAKVLAEPDAKKMEMDIIDEQIEATGRAFLGMTLGCARCHDHKFDPIPTDDYYALAAIFKSTKTMQDFKIVAKWFESSLATDGEIAVSKAHEAKLTAARVAVTNLLTVARQTLTADVQARAADYLVAAARLPATAATNEVAEAAEGAKLHAPVLQLCKQYLGKATNALFQVWREAAGRKDVDEIERHYRALFAETRQAVTEVKPGTNALPNVLQEAARKALADPKGFLALPAPAQAESLFPGATVDKLKQLRESVTSLEKAAPELASAMGVAEGTNVFKTFPVHIRGSHLTLGKPVARRMPQVMCGPEAEGFPEAQSGRLELANWLAEARNPMTARVAMNRIWRWHFGQGLVGTTDNFGQLGERPSHPELLDWLAGEFVTRGWSMKAMHRVLMLSATYQMSSAPDARDAAVDPENRLYWRANVQRLEAEQVRDALLAAAGTLDLTMGGKTIPVKNREFVFNHTSRDETTYGSLRRAVYLPIIRNHVYDLFEQFDFPDPAVPTGSRNATVVAPQALWLMNSDLILEAAEKLAARVLARPGRDDTARLQEAYLLTYGRPPTGSEEKRARKFLETFATGSGEGASRGQAWTAFCQSLFAANEFIYLN
jgi:hypothetical protein